MNKKLKRGIAISMLLTQILSISTVFATPSYPIGGNEPSKPINNPIQIPSEPYTPPESSKPSEPGQSTTTTYGNVNVTTNKDVIGLKEETSVSANSSGDLYGGSVTVNVELNQKLHNLSNIVVLDVARFNLHGFPYEIELMRNYIKETSEYKFADVIDIREYPIELGRDTSGNGRKEYYPFERSLVHDGIVRHKSDLTYSMSDNLFTWGRSTEFTYNEDDKIDMIDFLATLGRVAGITDHAYISARSTATWIPTVQLNEQRYKGRQRVEDSPYKKEVMEKVDIGENVVLVDYNDREYIIYKLDNIYLDYLIYLRDIGVLDEKFFNTEKTICAHNIPERLTKTDKFYELSRVNYDSIYISELIEPDANVPKKWDWKKYETLQKHNDGYMTSYPRYNTIFQCGVKEHQEYDYNINNGAIQYVNPNQYNTGNVTGATLPENTPMPGVESFKMKAKIPQVFQDQKSISKMEGLNFIYKFMKYNEKEETLNKTEVDTIVSLYGLELSSYTSDEVEMLKYLIAKGILNPDEDNLQVLQGDLIYSDLLKYMYRLAYPVKRFDFKTLSLTAQDIQLYKNGFMKDTLTLTDNDFSEFNKNKSDAMNDFLGRNSNIEYVNVYLEITPETVALNDYTVSDSKDYSIVFQSSPIKIQGITYLSAVLPKTYKNSVVMRSRKVGEGYKVELENWDDGGIYNLNTDRNKFTLVSTNMGMDETEITVAANRSFAGENFVEVRMDGERPYLYKGLVIWDKDNKKLNPELPGGKFEYDENKKVLTVKGIDTMEELNSLLREITPPPELSASDIIFMGWSRLNMNGVKTTLVRDRELSKFGIEILEDNVLYNTDLDTYAYLDPRTSTLYYGNTVVRFEEDALMVDYIEDTKSKFYNLDVIKTILTGSINSNGSVANEILEQLPKDVKFTVKDRDGYIMDKVFMIKDTTYLTQNNNQPELWMNTATLSNKNSNFIFFKDLRTDLNLYINYRAKIDKDINGEQSKTDARFQTYINSLKNTSYKEHPSTNIIMRTILAYNGVFTDNDYDYGVRVMYSHTADRETKKKLLFYQFMSIFEQNYNERTHKENFIRFVKSLYTVSDVGMYTIPNIPGLESYKDYTMTQFKDLVDGLTPESKIADLGNVKELSDIKKSTWFTIAPSYIDIELNKIGSNAKELSTYIINNNLYFRFKSASRLSDLDKSEKYGMMSTLKFAYQKETGDIVKIKDEVVIYTDTPKDYIPLEHWPNRDLINVITKLIHTENGSEVELPLQMIWHKKVLLRSTNAVIPDFTDYKSYLFDRLEYKAVEEDSIADVIWMKFKLDVSGIREGKEVPKDKVMKVMFEEMKKQSPMFKGAIENSNLREELGYNDFLLENMIKESLNNNNNNRPNPSNQGDRIRITHSNWNNFKFINGTEYYAQMGYLIPGGSVILDVSQPDEYTARIDSAKFMRGTKSEVYDIVNQTIARIFEEQKVVEIKKGDALKLPSGILMVSLGDSTGEFAIIKDEQVGVDIDAEETLLWKFENDLNVRVGLTKNAFNGVTSIKLPNKDEYTDIISLAKMWREDDFKRTHIGYITPEGTLKTGKYNNSGVLTAESTISSEAYIHPKLTLDIDLPVIKLYTNSNQNSMYIMKDVNMNTDMNFVDYLKDGILRLDAPHVSTADRNAFLEQAKVEESLLELFKLRNFDLIFGRLMMYVRYLLPWLLIIYGVISGAFVVLASTSAVKDFLWYALPEWLYYGMFKVLTVFSAEDGDEIPILQGMLKSSAITATGILWLTFVTRSLLTNF